MKKFVFALIVTIPLAGAAGYLLSAASSPAAAIPTSASEDIPVFHDIRVNTIESFPALTDPSDPAVVKLAKGFTSLEDAYRYVQDEIKFVPFAPPGPVAATIQHGAGSCIGKATLLYSLYRAMGLPANDIRIFMGLVVTPEGMADHVWIDLEINGRCLQQDPSGMLGRFSFDEFPGNRYAATYVMKETFCFNETRFAVVSQLNRMR